MHTTIDAYVRHNKTSETQEKLAFWKPKSEKYRLNKTSHCHNDWFKAFQV